MSGELCRLVLVVQLINRLFGRIVQDVLGAELNALRGARALIGAHALHVVHHLVMRSGFGAKRVHNLAGNCRNIVGVGLRCVHGPRHERDCEQICNPEERSFGAHLMVKPLLSEM